jgi:hypothetical protein
MKRVDPVREVGPELAVDELLADGVPHETETGAPGSDPGTEPRG